MSDSLRPVYDFLTLLSKHNNREWFAQNKTLYEANLQWVVKFVDKLLAAMHTFDHIETPSGKRSLFRIYRDVRFSKNKSPYKTSWSGAFRRATPARRGGYYFHLEPGNTFLAGGFFGPNPADLRHIRNHIAADGDLLGDVLKSDDIAAYFGSMQGSKVKTSPKGFDKNHEHIDLLRYKQFILKHTFTDRESLSANFHESMADGMKRLVPFFDVMSDILTTDLNGISLI